MTNLTEEALNQVLAGLRDAEAPTGMERRILAAVDDRAYTKSPSKWPGSITSWLLERPVYWSASRSLKWSSALACTAAIALAVSILHRAEHVPAPSPLIAAPAPAEAVANSAIPPQPRPIARSTAKTNVPKARSVLHIDVVARSEMRAPSQPPPPMPLTEQEKLLLRVAHKSRPENFTALNPVLRAARDVEEQAEFQKFFEPSSTGDNE